MSTNANNLDRNGKQEQREGKEATSQLQTIFQYLQEHIATASMVSHATGVPQKCITRYKRDLEKANRLWELFKKNCELTGFKAWYITTDPRKALPSDSHQTSQLDGI